MRLVLLVVLLVLAAPSLAQSPAVYEVHPCEYRTPNGYEVECGTLAVPELRTDPESATIELAIMRVRRSDAELVADPLVFLTGGPGGNIVARAHLVFTDQFAPFTEARELIFVDQRGTGESQPRLYCTEITNLFVNTLDVDPSTFGMQYRRSQAIRDCQARLMASGVNLAAYNSAESAADLEDLRRALGFDQWNLLGVSYGSRLALTIMRDQPEGLRSVILDSVYPPQVDLYSELVPNGQRALEVLFATCEQVLACAEAYPDLEADFYELLNQLEEVPEEVMVRIPRLNTFRITVTSERVYDWVFNWLYSVPYIELIPRRIHDMRNGRWRDAAQSGLRVELGSLGVDLGMHYAVQCSEEIEFVDVERLANLANEFPHLRAYVVDNPNLNTRWLDRYCDEMGLPPSAEHENEPVRSDVPTLLLAGSFDPITPPHWAEETANLLSNSYQYELAGIGHGVVRSSICGMSLALDFLDDPASEPDSGCVQEQPRLRFVMP